MPRPYKDIESINKVHKYRAKGLSFREIARVMQKDVRVIHRWYSYPVDNFKKKEKRPIKKVLTR